MKQFYRFLGTAVAYSILNGGPGLPVFPAFLVRFWQAGSLDDVCYFDIGEFPCAHMRNFLIKIKAAESNVQFNKLTQEAAEQYPEWGLQAVGGESDFTTICRYLAYNFMLPNHHFIEQFAQGLQDYGIIDLLKKEPNLSVFLSQCPW